METKRCGKCGETKPPSGFSKARSRPDGLQWCCRSCQAIAHAERRAANLDRVRELTRLNERRYRAAHPEKYALRIRVVHLRKYGVTVEQYEELLATQDGVCWICHQKCPSGRRLAIDHKGDQVRGLLCTKCNRGLGNFDDDPGRLERAAEYLRRAAAQALCEEQAS